MKHNVLFYRGYGKVGNLVGYAIYGKQAFRAYNPEVRNPRTELQQMQRAKIGLLTTLLQVFKPAVRMGFVDEARQRGCSAVNFFTHKNYGNVTGTAADNVSIDPSKIVIAQGALPGVVFSSTIGMATPGSLTVTVSDIQMGVGDASSNDNIYCFLYCPDAKAGIISAAAKRVDGASITFRYPPSWSGLDVHVYGFVMGGEDATRDISSNSEYIGHAELG